MSLQGLRRIPIVHNTKYQRSGLKSYASLLTRYGFEPTVEGPYYLIKQGEKLEHGYTRNFGGARVLRKKPHSSTPPKGSGSGSGSGTGSSPGTGTTAPPSTGGSSETGEVPAEDIQNDSEYLCEVDIGTPAQKFMLDFDTGSADLWLWSTELSASTQSSGKSAGHNIYNPAASSTYKASSGSTWSISYGDGSTASGDVGTDNVTVGGLTIENQSIELAKTLSAQFASGAGDGLLGLAFGSINTVKPTPVATPVENMITQKDIPQNAELFTVFLTNVKDTSISPFYTFGYIDQDTVTATGGSISYTPIDNSQGFWTFDSTSASVNGKTVTRSGNTAIADTGTTLALVDDATCKAIYGQIPGAKVDSQQQGWVFPTNTALSSLPVVEFAVGGKLFAVHKEDLAYADAGNGNSYGGIQSRGSMTFDILGDTFLKGIYAVFDQGNTRFGAVQRPDSSTSTSS